MKLSDLVTAYMDELPVGIVVTQLQVERSIKNAVRFYCGYAVLKSAPPTDTDEDELTPPYHTAITAGNEITGGQDYELSPSEWAIIRPLFVLYVELENAAALEATRALGLDVYGRQTSEVQADIREREAMMPKDAFMESVVTV